MRSLFRSYAHDARMYTGSAKAGDAMQSMLLSVHTSSTFNVVMRLISRAQDMPRAEAVAVIHRVLHALSRNAWAGGLVRALAERESMGRQLLELAARQDPLLHG